MPKGSAVLPKINSVFSHFTDLDKVSVADINSWLTSKEQTYILENFIGNRMLYPHAVPTDSHAMELDLAILREYIRTHLDNYYSEGEGKIIIPEQFIERFPPLPKLIKVILDVLSPVSTTQILVAKKNTEAYLAMIIRAPAQNDFICLIDNHEVKILADSIAVVSTNKQEVKVKIGDQEEIPVPAGDLGIIFDTRVLK